MTTDDAARPGAAPDLAAGRELLIGVSAAPWVVRAAVGALGTLTAHDIWREGGGLARDWVGETGGTARAGRDAALICWLRNNAESLLTIAGSAAALEREVGRLRERLRVTNATLLRLETALEEALERSAWEQAEAARGERDADMGQGSGGTQDMARNRFRLPQDGPDGPQTASDGTAALRGQNSAETAVRR